MFHVQHKCNSATTMGNDNSGHLDEWPKPKKSRTEECCSSSNNFNKKAEEEEGLESAERSPPGWECLPAVILDNVIQYLSFKEIISASSTCHTWRQSLYHPRSWQQVTFVIYPDTLDQVRYLRGMVGHLVSHATIKFNSMQQSCVHEFLLLMEYLQYNKILQSLVLEPSHCIIETPLTPTMNNTTGVVSCSLQKSLAQICTNRVMKKLTLGGDEVLLQQVPQLLDTLAAYKPHTLSTLGLASVKEDPTNYLILNCDPQLFLPFTGLKIISIDYDILSDAMLESLRGARSLERLVVHVHGIWEGHPGTSEEGWYAFRQDHPTCLLRLSLIHAYDEVPRLHDLILRHNMPLSHLKVLFCESMNRQALENLVRYQDTFVSVMWVDSLMLSKFKKESGGAYSLLSPSSPPPGGGAAGAAQYHHEADLDGAPRDLILLSWLCKKLEEIVVIGYKYCEVDWIGVVKLRSNTLKRLEIASDDVVNSSTVTLRDEYPACLGESWAPLRESQLHPVLIDPTTGDSDEYLMPILLADLH